MASESHGVEARSARSTTRRGGGAPERERDRATISAQGRRSGRRRDKSAQATGHQGGKASEPERKSNEAPKRQSAQTGA